MVSPMVLYAQHPARRTRQILGDLLVLGWIGLCFQLAQGLRGLVERLAGPGREVEGAGRDLARSMDRIGDRVGRVPIAGDDLEGPFRRASTVGDRLVAAGRAEQEVVADLALYSAILVALLPIAVVLWTWLPRRLRWIREATAARDLGEDTELFALRALAHRPLSQLRRIAPDPAAAVLRGDAEVTARLAQLELTALGAAPALSRAASPARAGAAAEEGAENDGDPTGRRTPPRPRSR